MSREVVRKTLGVAGGLWLDARERPFRLRFHRAERSTIEVQQVVREAEAGLHLELPERDSPTSSDIGLATALDEPASGRQLGVDFASGPLFWCLRHCGARPLSCPNF